MYLNSESLMPVAASAMTAVEPSRSVSNQDREGAVWTTAAPYTL
jgi:hypothetical protein